MASLADETPEGRSIVVLAKQYGIRERDLDRAPSSCPFTAETRMSGVDVDGTAHPQGRRRRDQRFVAGAGGQAPPELRTTVDRDRPRGRHAARRSRATARCSASIYLKDVVKEGMTAPLRPAAGDGHPDGDGHRRQPADRREDRRRSPGSTTSSPRRRPSASSS